MGEMVAMEYTNEELLPFLEKLRMQEFLLVHPELQEVADRVGRLGDDAKHKDCLQLFTPQLDVFWKVVISDAFTEPVLRLWSFDRNKLVASSGYSRQRLIDAAYGIEINGVQRFSKQTYNLTDPHADRWKAGIHSTLVLNTVDIGNVHERYKTDPMVQFLASFL